MNIFDLLKTINLNSIVTNTNKILNVIKKSIPIYKEIRPYVRHEKSLLKNKKEIEPLKENNNSSYNDTLSFFN